MLPTSRVRCLIRSFRWLTTSYWGIAPICCLFGAPLETGLRIQEEPPEDEIPPCLQLKPPQDGKMEEDLGDERQ